MMCNSEEGKKCLSKPIPVQSLLFMSAVPFAYLCFFRTGFGLLTVAVAIMEFCVHLY